MTTSKNQLLSMKDVKNLTNRFEEARSTRKLNLSYAGLTEFPVECIELIKNARITELELSSNNLSTLPEELGKLIYLRILRLKYNKFTQLPKVLQEFKHLAVLELSGNQISTIDDCVKDLVAVKELDLSGNMISKLPDALSEMPRLEVICTSYIEADKNLFQVLYLEHNQIEELPESFGLLKSVVKVNLSTNGLRKLPKSMARMKQLQRINCANNLLTSVPSEFGFLKTLKEFNLRSNNLDDQYRAKSDEGLSRFLSFLREQHEQERLEEIERLRPVGTQVGAYTEYRCKSEEKQIVHSTDGVACFDNRCWIRAGHTICQVENVIYIFGGCVVKDGLLTNDLFWISMDRMEWNLQKTSGEKPCPRQNHVCIFDPDTNSLIIFGGKADNKKYLNDLYSLKLDTMVWTKITANGVFPSPREHASALYWEQNLILFGGFGSGTRLNDFWFLDLCSMMWSQPPLNGTSPSPRQSASLCIINSTQILLHGGKNHFVLDDFFLYDILTHNWNSLQTTGRCPPPYYEHQITSYGNSIYLFGGFDELGAASESMYTMTISLDMPLTQTTLHWEEWESQLEPNRCRTCILNETKLSIIQVGSRSLGIPSSEAFEKGTVQWNVFKVAELKMLEKKVLDEASLKPKNPKLVRIQHIMSILSTMPKSYTIQTPKEQRAIEYAQKFEEQFFSLYRHRRSLFLIPENECGVQKLVCSTLRPTKLHFIEIHSLDSIARFISDFVQYDPLDNPLHPPQYLTSPTSTLKWQAGDSFDVSVLLASLLIGVGYDAYVCMGYAPKSVVFNDQTDITYGFKDWDDLVTSVMPCSVKEEHKESNTIEEERYKPRLVPSLPTVSIEGVNKALPASVHVSPLESREDHLQKESYTSFGEKQEQQVEGGEFTGRYYHAWVMVAPTSRDVSETLMIETSTGSVYKAKCCPYEGIEAVFNDKNFWICMQMPEPHSDSRADPSVINYDLEKQSEWEKVFPSTEIKALCFDENESLRNSQTASNSVTSRHSTTGTNCSNRVSKVPTSWVSRLHIPQEMFDMRCPRARKSTITLSAIYVSFFQGQKFTNFKNCQHSKFAFFGECARWDGMTEQITYFEGMQPSVIDQLYDRRKDKIIRRCSKLNGENTTDCIKFFAPGNPHSLKALKQTVGKSCYTEFYPESRVDGLVSRTEFTGHKIIDMYMKREDHLIYRSITYEMPQNQESGPQTEESNIGDEISVQRSQSIRKITEKFERDFSEDCDSDIAKRVFYLTENKIRIDFHFGKGRITRSSRIFSKEGKCHVVQAGIVDKRFSPGDLEREYNIHLIAERNCIQTIRDLEKEMKDIWQDCQQQDQNVKLATPYYDAYRDNNGMGFEVEKDTGLQEESDFLSVYIPKNMTNEMLSREDALMVRERCLKALKERLIERANIMQARYDEESVSWSKTMANYQRDKDQMTLEQVTEHEKTTASIMFRMNIIKKRLKKHEQQALKRYFDLDQKLRKDSRLKAMLQAN